MLSCLKASPSPFCLIDEAVLLHRVPLTALTGTIKERVITSSSSIRSACVPDLLTAAVRGEET